MPTQLQCSRSRAWEPGNEATLGLLVSHFLIPRLENLSMLRIGMRLSELCRHSSITVGSSVDHCNSDAESLEIILDI